MRKDHDVPQGQKWHTLEYWFVFAMIGHGIPFWPGARDLLAIVSTPDEDSQFPII
jgi:hypothetical protein